jgi:tetratricopeptide (TPR) repeat protein
MKKLYLILALLFCTVVLYAQKMDTLQKRLSIAKTPKEKIKALNNIAAYYMYSGVEDSVANVYSDKLIQVARQSGDKYLITWANYLNGRRLMSLGGVNETERLKLSNQYLQTALTLSRENSQPDLEATVCIQLSAYSRRPRVNQVGKAMEYIQMAQSILATNPNDSLSVMASNSAAAIYLAKGDQLNAFRNYNNALNTAERLDKPNLIADTYKSLAQFYTSLEDYDKALDYLLKAYKLLNDKNAKGDDVVMVLSQIGGVYVYKKDYATARKYFTQMHDKAKALNLHETMVTQPLFYIEATYLEQGDYKSLVQYLKNPQLTKIIKQYKQEYLMDWYRGVAFDQQNQRDSADYYYNRVLKPAAALAPPSTIIAIYTTYGFYQIKNGQSTLGLQWLEKAKDISIKMNDLSLQTFIYHNLDSAYAKTGNKARAYDYRVMYDKFNDSLKNQSKLKQLTLAEVNAESQRLKLQQQKEEEALRKKHNLQYMGITAAIASVFILLVLMGFFTTSASIIRGLGFFAFIFFFEFITLLCDHVIHDWTHGEPLKIMAIKIVFVALLLPLHHYVEEKVIHHLIHRKKIKLGKFGKSKQVEEAIAISNTARTSA